MKTGTLIGAGALATLLATAGVGLAEAEGPEWPTNGPPLVRIITPQEGADFLFGRAINICAQALNFTDRVAQVQFFAGTNSLGTVTNMPSPWRDDFGGRFACITWNNAAPGAYTLLATATDLAGLSVTSAPVDIMVVTDLPPVVRIVSPRNEAQILGPTNVTITASAFDPDGRVASVRFFEGKNLLGVVSNTPPVMARTHHGDFPIRQTAYSLTWSNVAVGTYSLTAEATDNSGATATSDAVQVTVTTNLPPVVRIVHPENGARFFSPANINISAVARDPDGSVSSVEFFAGPKKLDVVTSGTSVTNHEGRVRTFYSFTWSNVLAATYPLTAVATDNGGASGTSAPVQVTVVEPPPPQVKIVHPENGATFAAPANIRIAAVTRFFTNHIARVEFLAGGNLLGTVTNNWYWATFLWPNVPVGTYSLTSIATDTGGISATSGPVNINVVSNAPPSRMRGHH